MKGVIAANPLDIKEDIPKIENIFRKRIKTFIFGRGAYRLTLLSFYNNILKENLTRN